MAKSEVITDDLTGEEIQYPYISARSLRVELSPTKYVWIGDSAIMAFASVENLAKWAKARYKKIIEQEEGERDY